jgi:hypothetical protein
MTSSEQPLKQDALALLAACVPLVVAKDTAGSVRRAFLNEALCAAETIEALMDPTRDAPVPLDILPRAAPDMRFQRLMLTQSLLVGHRKPKHLRVTA